MDDLEKVILTLTTVVENIVIGLAMALGAIVVSVLLIFMFS